MPIKKKNILYVFLGLLLILAACFVYWKITEPERMKPDFEVMRTYRISRLTDTKIKDLQIGAKAEREKRLAAYQEEYDGFWIGKRATLDKCNSDSVFKLRNPNECTLPIMWQSIGQPNENDSVDRIFEFNLMGICIFIDTVKKAKEIGCLPK